jgi:hypothetical protein
MNHLARISGSRGLHVGVFVLAVLAGCSGISPEGDPSWIFVHVNDVSRVAGEWEGTVQKEHATFSKGSVRLMIRENGSYLFAGEDAKHLAVGAGSLHVRDGRLIGDTNRRAVTLSLYTRKDQEILSVESTNHETGERYHGRFTRAQ